MLISQLRFVLSTELAGVEQVCAITCLVELVMLA